jgi:hypothetical protein
MGSLLAQHPSCILSHFLNHFDDPVEGGYCQLEECPSKGHTNIDYTLPVSHDDAYSQAHCYY